MPDLSHLWQRFLLASSLVAGLALGVAATVFGYSNLASVNVRWSIFHIDGVPLWTVALVPLALVLIAGTIYHWMDGLHHFTEHMRHRRRVHELEAEIATLRTHLDQVLDMPDHSTSRLPAKPTVATPLPEEGITALGPTEFAALPEPARAETAPANGSTKVVHRRSRKRAAVAVASEPAAQPTAGASASAEPAVNGAAEKGIPAETPAGPESEA